MRLDIALVEWGFEPSRSKAKASIKAGLVLVDGKRVTKASLEVSDFSQIEVEGTACPYVGRGGLKLEGAIKSFALVLDGMTCVDVGSSTGGFTECMLQFGAKQVFSVDVGTGQLDSKLLADPRVVSMEGTDIRDVSQDDLGGAADFAATDVSFISLDKVLPSMARLLCDGGEAVCLIKPQFEAGRESLGKNGIVRDPKVHVRVIEKVLQDAADAGFAVCDLDYSPISGGDGNIEYLMHARKTDPGEVVLQLDVAQVVARAHDALREG